LWRQGFGVGIEHNNTYWIDTDDLEDITDPKGVGLFPDIFGNHTKLQQYDAAPVAKSTTFTTDFAADANKLTLAGSVLPMVGETVWVSSTTTLPTGLTAATPLFVLNVSSSDIELGISPNGSPITLTGNGTGTHTITWSTYKTIGEFIETGPEKVFSYSKTVSAKTTDTFTTDFASDANELTASGTAPADGTPVLLSSSTTLPAGTLENRIYWVVNSSGSTFELSTERGGSPVTLTDDGTGTHTVTSGGLVMNIPNAGGCPIKAEVTACSTADANRMSHFRAFIFRDTGGASGLTEVATDVGSVRKYGYELHFNGATSAMSVTDTGAAYVSSETSAYIMLPPAVESDITVKIKKL
jgi:hypothetical protein